MTRPARPDDVDEICAALPSTGFGTSWGDVPTWKVPARIDHFRNYNAVLVRQSRLGELSLDELTEVIHDAWLAVAPKRLAEGFLADG